MNVIVLFLTSALTALAVENVVLGRALGISRHTLFLESSKQCILYGGLLTVLVTISSVLTAGVNALLHMGDYQRYVPFIRAPLYFICVALVYSALWFGTQKYNPLLHIRIRSAMPISAFNTALFSALYTASNQSFGFFQATGYALGTGIGYTLALLALYYARKRLAMSQVPRIFRGLPITLMYIGLLSLAVYGLIGYNLVF